MKTPTWKLIVGGLLLIFGLYGTIGSVLSIAGTLSMSAQIQTDVVGDDPAENDTSIRQPQNDLTQLFNDIHTWAITMSVITLVVSVVYSVGGIALITKPHGQRVFYVAIAMSVIWAIVKIVFFTQGDIQILLAMLPALAPSLIIDLIFTSIVFVKTRNQVNKQVITINQDPPAAQTPSSTSSSISMKIPTITGWFAALCVGIFPLWIMGVPGVKNDYALGWEMGLQVLWMFPLAWVMAYGLFRLLKKTLHARRHKTVDLGIAICLSVFLGLAILRLSQALNLIAG